MVLKKRKRRVQEDSTSIQPSRTIPTCYPGLDRGFDWQVTNEIALSLRIYGTFACYLVHLSLILRSRIVGWWSSGGGGVVVVVMVMVVVVRQEQDH